MAESKHTPGPWEADLMGSLTSAEIRPIDDFTVIARVTRLDTEANARLIAAAPELLEACRVALLAFTYAGDDATGLAAVAERDIRAATAKAEGR